MKTLGNNFQELRKQENLTQQQLADLTGIALSTIKNIESEVSKTITAENLSKLINCPRLMKYGVFMLLWGSKRQSLEGMKESIDSMPDRDFNLAEALRRIDNEWPQDPQFRELSKWMLKTYSYLLENPEQGEPDSPETQ